MFFIANKYYYFEKISQGGCFISVKVVLIVLAVIAAIHIISMLTLDRRVQYTESEYTSPRVPDALDGYRIALVADTHAAKRELLEGIAAEISARGADVVLLGGDIADGEGGYPAVSVLGGVKAADGVFGVDGNHDRAEKLLAVMRENGVKLLANSGVELKTGMYLAGVEDVYRGTPDPARAMAGAAPQDFVLLLCHNPDISMERDVSRADLMLCGHTHGGHATIFGLWSPPLTLTKHVSKYGQRFMGGFAKNESGTDVYVSRGVGYHHSVPRVFARPEVAFITLRQPK